MDMVQQKFSFQSLFHFITKFLLYFLFVVILGIIVFLIVYMGDLFVHTLRGDTEKPLFGAYVIMSGSMTPSINVMDGIVVKRVDHDEYEVGDIITFVSQDSRYEGATITHRIVEKRVVDSEESIYTTKGDHNPIIDSSPVKTDAIYGKVLFKIPKIGYVKDFFLKPTNYFACLLGIALLFMICQGGYILLLLWKEKNV